MYLDIGGNEGNNYDDEDYYEQHDEEKHVLIS